MTYSTENKIFPFVSETVQNLLAFQGKSIKEFSDPIIFKFKLTYPLAEVDKRASVFAHSLINLNHEWRYVFTPYQHLWVCFAERTFIYSYAWYLCILHNPNCLDYVNENSYVFIGHALAALAYVKPNINFVDKTNDINVILNIDKDSDLMSDSFRDKFTLRYPTIGFQSVGENCWIPMSPIDNSRLGRLFKELNSSFGKENKKVRVPEANIIDLSDQSSVSEIRALCSNSSVFVGNSCVDTTKVYDSVKKIEYEVSTFNYVPKTDTLLELNPSIWLSVATDLLIVEQPSIIGQSIYRSFVKEEVQYARNYKYEVHALTYLRCQFSPRSSEYGKTDDKLSEPLIEEDG